MPLSGSYGGGSSSRSVFMSTNQDDAGRVKAYMVVDKDMQLAVLALPTESPPRTNPTKDPTTVRSARFPTRSPPKVRATAMG